ncbi:hypothetical protein C7N43_30040 [Sphingobacteriales bacterium UPWRP_1]|nr:hypothetical protein B6N25_17090 [Sphingobacteriales bacterium TSM_CSS]PSJ73248.1 hypothetical protein C7N43_30040 [Sphingobacteriales bacterium UPWRP_1]
MKQNLLFITTLCAALLLSGGQCKKEDAEKPQYFDCDYYHYLPNDGFPVLTPEDSAATAEFLVKKGLYSKQYLEWRDVIGKDFLFPYIAYSKNEIDTTLFNRFLAGISSKSKPIYKSLNWHHLHKMIMSDATIIGTVVDRKYIRDSIHCFYHKTLFVVQVNEVLYSRFPLKKGNYFLGGLDTGFSGGCTLPGEEEYFSYDSDVSNFNVGEKLILGVNHRAYASFFIGRQFEKGKFQDSYCSNMFRIYTEDRWDLRDTKDFFNKHKIHNYK